MKSAWISDTLITRFGPLWVAVSEAGLVGIQFSHDRAALETWLGKQGFDPILSDEIRTRPILEQIRAYLSGERQDFDLTIDWSVLTDFQAKTLQATLAIRSRWQFLHKFWSGRKGSPG